MKLKFTLTKERALQIQQQQVAHYLPLNPNLPEQVAAITTAHLLEPGVEYPVDITHQHIPCGAAIEALCGLDINRFKD